MIVDLLHLSIPTLLALTLLGNQEQRGQIHSLQTHICAGFSLSHAHDK